jgi:hypothetical protein
MFNYYPLLHQPPRGNLTHCPLPNHKVSHHLNRLELVQVVRLYLPLICLVASSEVACGSGVILEGPQQPVENGLAESAAVGIA